MASEPAERVGHGPMDEAFRASREELDRLRDKLALMSRHFFRQMGASLHLPAVLNEVLDAACDFTGAPQGALVITGPSGETAERMVRGCTRATKPQSAQPPATPSAQTLPEAPDSPPAVAFCNHPECAESIIGGCGGAQCLSAPLRHDGETFGSVHLSGKATDKEFTPDDASLLGLFAAQAALVIHKARASAAPDRPPAGIAEQVPFGIWTADAAGVPTYHSQSFLSMLGMTENEVRRDPWSQVHPDDRAALKAEWDRCVKAGSAFAREYRILGADKQYRHILTRGVPVKDDMGCVTSWVGVNVDATEGRQPAESLRESGRRFQSLVENSRDIFIRRRRLPEPAYEFVSPVVEAVTGYRPEEFYADPNFVIEKLTHPEDRPLFLAMRESPAAFGKPLVLRWVRNDGQVIWVEERLWPVYNQAGEMEAVEGVMRDVTERKRAEDEQEKLRADFRAMLSHEMKTPLTTIKGAAATALSSGAALDPAEARELFLIIDQQTNRLREIVSELLNAQRAHATRFSLALGPVDLHAVLEEAREAFAESGRRQAIDLHLPDDLPAVNADRMRVTQVVNNLLDNASQFSPPDSRITVDVEHDGREVTVRVRDSGRGIAAAELPLLFKVTQDEPREPGAVPAIKGAASGGMGLAICKEIVEAHRGRIWAESPGAGKGATFSFTLPVISVLEEKRPTARTLPDTTQKSEHLGKVARAGERTRVLVVDDDEQMLTYLKRALGDAGYQPIALADPVKVHQTLELESPDIVLLDLKLGGDVSGLDVLQELRKTSGVPVIIVTGSDPGESAARALQLGADDYVTKPFNDAELMARVQAVLRRRVFADVMEPRPPLEYEGLVIDFMDRRVTVGGQEVQLSATEYKILYELAQHAGRTLTFDQILQRVWGPEYSGETGLVRSFIRNIRRKLGDDAQNPKYILTERQVGYRMPKP